MFYGLWFIIQFEIHHLTKLILEITGKYSKHVSLIGRCLSEEMTACPMSVPPDSSSLPTLVFSDLLKQTRFSKVLAQCESKCSVLCF